ncbi:MAG TPA: hypothetical protein VLD86_17595 [Ilumatobacteraceae bacterium]|nr:hypothetical protein [Ilumatobacteraceae bacterium]
MSRPPPGVTLGLGHLREGVSALLLDVVDVGEGWSATTALSPEDLGSIADSPCAALVVNPTIVERLKPTTGVQFQPTDGSKRGSQEVTCLRGTRRPERRTALGS